MLISEVSSILCMSIKSIRYYEAQGLLVPKRNNQNDYRLYSEEDVDKLKKIKFLRELDVSVLEIKKLFNNQVTLREVMNDRINKIDRTFVNLKQVKSMCQELADLDTDESELIIDDYLLKMNILNKEGFSMKKNNDVNNRKILGAISSGVFFSLFFVIMIGIITYFQFTLEDNIPLVIYFFLIVILSIPLVSVIINIIVRIKEIKGGEEDEASKY